MPDIPLAKKLIKEAADLCIDTAAIAERHAHYAARREKTKLASTPIATSKETVLADARSAIDTRFKEAEKNAAERKYSAAHTLLDEVQAESEKAEWLKNADEEFVKKLAAIKKAVGDLTKSTPPDSDPVIGGDIAKIDQKIGEAQQAVVKPGYKYKEAMESLAQAEAGQGAAGVKKKMKGNDAPSEDELKDLMSKPGGTKLLDEIVANLGKNAQQKVLLVAMKVRFGLDAAVSYGKGKKGATPVAEAGTKSDSDLSLQKIYSLLTKVPDKHTKDNPSFKKITRYAGDPGKKGSLAKEQGDYYDNTGKEVVLSLGRPGDGVHPLGNPSELPDVTDPNCQPADKTPPTHFDNNTLHEAAHAIDDKKKFMDRNGSKPEYGGWIVIKIVDAALAAAEALKYDAGYIVSYLTDPKAKTAEPPCPNGRKQSDWDAACKKAKAWADAIRHDKDPWEKGSLCNKDIAAGGIRIGDRIYHQAYSATWVSYLADSRKQGITGYQFRASGEWFSELYAAYGMRKLKKSHPAVKLFLEKMFPLNPPLT
jgi:hypothetical protein